MASELEIIVLQPGGRLLGSFVHADARIVLGSGAGSTVVIPDKALLAEHAVIHFTGRSCIIECLPGAPAFLANGNAVESHLVQPQDTIVLGAHTLRMVVHRDAVAAPPPAAAAPPPVVAAPPPVVPAPPPASKPIEKEADTVITEPMNLPRHEPAKKERKVALVPQEPEVTQKVVRLPPAVAPAPAPVKPAPVKAAPSPKAAPPPKAAPAAKSAPVQGALALKPEPLPPAQHEEEPDEDDEEEHYEPFPILDALTAPTVLNGPLLAQAIRSRDNFVTKVLHVPPGKATKLGDLTVRHTKEGMIVLVGKVGKGRAEKKGQKIALDSLRQGAELQVPAGTRVLLELSGSSNDTLVLQHVPRASSPPPQKRSYKLEREDQRALAVAVALHLLAVVVFGLSSAAELVVDNNEGRYAEVKLKDLELEPPPPAPPEAPPAPEPPPVAEKAPPLKKAPKQPQAKAAPSAPSPPAAPQKSAAAANLLSALGGPPTPSPSNALAAATNLDAVAAPKGAGFKVSGVIGKMPGNELKLGAAGSGVGRVDTKSANELTKGGTLGKVTGAAPSGHVRGVVSGPPPKSVEVQGQLDRSEIQKVVNDHLHEVQGCYERQLVKDPSLAGKIVSEWVITPAGTVGTVKIKSSSVRNNEVANCIQASLKRWKFPQPKGGSVTVTYPFVFSTIGM